MERREFHAMGTEVEVLLDLPRSPVTSGALVEAEREFARIEAALSRFLPGSELSTLNRSGRIKAGPDLLAATELALAARARTGGRFDPTVHDALVAAGYDRSFEQVPSDRVAPGENGSSACAGAVEIDRFARTIRLGAGVKLDLGGIGKGYAVDRAVERLSRLGPCLVNAGGDVAVRGRRWPIGVETANGFVTLELVSGALATSGSDRRRWQRNGEEQHHLIDPGTGRPSASDLVRVTVVGTSASEAEVLAKSLFLAGEEDAAEEAKREGVPAILVTADGRTVMTGPLG
jgi:thiamine biosynthesis lipoprotein